MNLNEAKAGAPIKLFFLTCQIRKRITVGFDELLLALSSSLNGWLSHLTEFFEDALFSCIGFVGIARGVLDDSEESIEFGLQFRVALGTGKKFGRVG